MRGISHLWNHAGPVNAGLWKWIQNVTAHSGKTSAKTGGTSTRIWCWGLVACNKAKPSSVQKKHGVPVDLAVVKPDDNIQVIGLSGGKDFVKRYTGTELSMILNSQFPFTKRDVNTSAKKLERVDL